jgi:hypothetical protein
MARGNAVAISYVTQTRSVSASSSATGVARGGTDTTPTTNNQSQSQQAGGFGDFNGGAMASSAIGPLSASASASASQVSSLTPTGFNASGSVRANTSFGDDGPATGTAITAFHISFDVQQAEAFTFTTTLNSSGDLASPGNTTTSIHFTDNSGNNVIAPIETVNLNAFQTTGTVGPGVYSVTLDAEALSNDESSNFINYDLGLSVPGSVQVTGGPVVGAVAPLPSAAKSAVLMLLGLAAMGWLKRRSAAAD